MPTRARLPAFIEWRRRCARTWFARAPPGVGWPDYWSFWQQGYPAFLVTDTLPFRDPEYHRASDTAERLDYVRMARLTEGLEAVVIALAK